MLTKLRNFAGKDIELAKYKKLTITLNFATKREEVANRDNFIRTRSIKCVPKYFHPECYGLKIAYITKLLGDINVL